MLACSALKRSYRDILRGEGGGSTVTLKCVFVLLNGPLEVLEGRMVGRTHFMSPQLLRSQLDTLEEPTEEEQCIKCDTTQPVSGLVEHIYQQIVTLV